MENSISYVQCIIRYHGCTSDASLDIIDVSLDIVDVSLDSIDVSLNIIDVSLMHHWISLMYLWISLMYHWKFVITHDVLELEMLQCFNPYPTDVQCSFELIQLKQLVITGHLSKRLLKPFQYLSLFSLPIIKLQWKNRLILLLWQQLCLES